MKTSFHSRCLLLCSVLVAGLSVLSGRLIQIQLVNRRHYEEKARRDYHDIENLPADRGMIVDRHEEPLAKSIPVVSVVVDKHILMDPKSASFGLACQEASLAPDWAGLGREARSKRIFNIRGDILAREKPEIIVQKHLAYVIGILSRPLGIHREALRDKIENSRNAQGREVLSIPIARDMPEDIADQLHEEIRSRWIQGIKFPPSFKRFYCSPTMASHIIGFTAEKPAADDDGNPTRQVRGVFGVEASMEPFLAGRDGYREYFHDARGLVVPGNAGSLKPPRAGLNVKLTMDMGMQAIVEEELDAGLAEFQSQKGAVILMDPKTGEVLAMASRPNFDLNLREGLGKDGNGAGVNYAIQTIYEPGSTIKIVATSGALNEGLVSPQTSVFCHNGYYNSGGVILTDEHPAGTLTFEGVLQKSNNIGTFSLGRQLGARKFYDYLHGYGFGKKTGIQLSGEESGLARDTGNVVDFSRACFGYATNVTPLQLACAYSAVASDGKLRKPHIVKSLIANDGTVVEDYAPEVVREVLKPRTAAQMRAALQKVVTKEGTARLAAVEGFLVAGKTGTVQKHRENGGRGYYADKHIVSFVGMMPAQDPAFVCVVVIDDPRTTAVKIFGGSIAGPVFSKIATRVAARMNLQPTETIAAK